MTSSYESPLALFRAARSVQLVYATFAIAICIGRTRVGSIVIFASLQQQQPRVDCFSGKTKCNRVLR